MQNFAYDPFLVTFGLCAVFCFGLSLRVAFAISKPVISTMIPTYALSALFFAYPLLYWFKGAQGGEFGWLAGVLIALATICLSVVVFIASLLLHPWEQSSFFDSRFQEDPKAQFEQRYPNCRAKRLHSGKWLLTSKETGKTVGMVEDITPGAVGLFSLPTFHGHLDTADQPRG